MMVRYFTLEYWLDDGWYVGRLKEIPGVFSQGETLQDLEENRVYFDCKRSPG
jgi:predicted RNase H-like HicB family nuclease